MSARVLVIGLDAAEPSLLEASIRAGELPALASLTAAGTSGRVDNCMLTLPGAVWPEIASGVSCGTLPRFFHPRQVITGAAAPRPLTAADVADDPTFWRTAAEGGRRVAVVDIPHAAPAPLAPGVHVVDYGLHDTHFGPASTPAGLLEELQRSHGPYPVASCDHYGGSIAAHLRLLDDLRVGLQRKVAVLVDLLGRERWDLFACAFSEAHCAGHWFWRYHDPAHWDFVADAPAALRQAVGEVYRQLDDAVGRLLASAGSETAIVIASHGMAPYVAGYQLLPEVLARLGLSSADGARGRVLRDVQHTVKHWVPRRHWERLGRLVVEHPVARAFLRPLQRRQGAMFFPLESPQTRAVYVPNNTIGAIRLNLRGREPNGTVAPGAEAEALMAAIGADLRQLRQPSSGEPIVTSVVTATEVFGPDHHPDLPDLIVRFRQDLGLLDACESPRTGLVRVPVGSRWGRRTGDHSPHSAVWARGAAFPAGSRLAPASLLDVAPTVLHALDLPLPPWLDGRPLHAGAGIAPAAAEPARC
jgi:predicted AlkP superfamily phosphohydrolase/phosphomutase